MTAHQVFLRAEPKRGDCLNKSYHARVVVAMGQDLEREMLAAAEAARAREGQRVWTLRRISHRAFLIVSANGGQPIREGNPHAAPGMPLSLSVGSHVACRCALDEYVGPATCERIDLGHALPTAFLVVRAPTAQPMEAVK